MFESINAFLNSSAGTILIRLICISFIGAGANLIIQRTFARLELYENPKTKAKLQITADLFSYTINIILSVLVSFTYSRVEMPMADWIIEGILYGLGALAFQYFFTSGTFFEFFKIWRKK